MIGPGGSEESYFTNNEAEDGRSRFLDIPSGTECRLTIDGQTHVGVLRSGQLKVGRRSPFKSFSAAYQDIAGRSGNAWNAWEIRLPNAAEWRTADSFRRRLGATPEVVAPLAETASLKQVGLPAFPSGPAEKMTAPTALADVPKLKLPTAAALREIGKRFKGHTANLRELLADVQKLVEAGWPLTDSEYNGNLFGQIFKILEPIEIETHGARVLEVDTTLAALISDVEMISDNLNPGPKQGEWAKAVIVSSEVIDAAPRASLAQATNGIRAFGDGERFKFHIQHLRDLLADVQKIAEEEWPLFEPDYQGNLVAHIAAILEPIDFDTEAPKWLNSTGRWPR